MKKIINENKEVFTLSIYDIEEEFPIHDMQYGQTYYDWESAFNDAIKVAREYADDEHVINVSVFGG
ncbi:unnamed protein product, partial [marine sediment metagenome]